MFSQNINGHIYCNFIFMFSGPVGHNRPAAIVDHHEHNTRKGVVVRIG